MNKTHLIILISSLCFTFSCTKEAIDDGKYFPKVKSIIANNCTNSCHAPSKGLPQGMPVILETDEEISASAGNIKAAVADPITYFNKRMPENGTLSQSDIDIIVKWYEKGGKITD